MWSIAEIIFFFRAFCNAMYSLIFLRSASYLLFLAVICGPVTPVRSGWLGFTEAKKAAFEMVAYIAGFTVNARKP